MKNQIPFSDGFDKLDDKYALAIVYQRDHVNSLAQLDKYNIQELDNLVVVNLAVILSGKPDDITKREFIQAIKDIIPFVVAFEGGAVYK